MGSEDAPSPDLEETAAAVVDAAFHVRREPGAGLLERVYHVCLVRELLERGHDVRAEVRVPVVHKGKPMGLDLRLDLLVDQRVVVEVKAVEALNDAHVAQVLTHLRWTGCRLGLLVNFNAVPFGAGIHRLVL